MMSLGLCLWFFQNATEKVINYRHKGGKPFFLSFFFDEYSAFLINRMQLNCWLSYCKLANYSKANFPTF